MYDSTGQKRRAYQLDKRGGSVRQYLVHPEGKQLLVLTEQLYHVKIKLEGQ